MAQGNSHAFSFGRIAPENPDGDAPREFQNVDAELSAPLPENVEVELCLDFPDIPGGVPHDVIEQRVMDILQIIVGPLPGGPPQIVVHDDGHQLAEINEQPMNQEIVDDSAEETESAEDEDEEDFFFAHIYQSRFSSRRRG